MKVMSKAHEKSFHPKVARLIFKKVQNDVIIIIVIKKIYLQIVTNTQNIFTYEQVFKSN